MSIEGIDEQKAEDLVRNLLASYNDNKADTLQSIFESKLAELAIGETQACRIIGIESRALKAILFGTGTRIDITALLKFAAFVGMTDVDVMKKYMDSVTANNDIPIEDIDKRKFISSQFDLPQLKKEGIIPVLDDFDHIEYCLLKYLGYESILDYRKDVLNPVYSSTKRHRDDKMTDMWIDHARQIFRRINNPNEYNRKSLIDFFPKIRWHSLNVEKGLLDVMRTLYNMGITVIYKDKYSSLHLRGATFAVNNKPCIVLTNYKGYYSTLWFALIHELHHVLFDWDKILINSFHISVSEEHDELFIQAHMEEEADKFAREYLFPAAKMETVNANINDWYFVESFAIKNHVHPSIVFTFYAHDNDRWGLAERHKAPIEECLKSIAYRGESKDIEQISNYIKKSVLNRP